ncbi:leucine carboxyl methyltransferase [Aspergillus germanicus]
MPKSKQPAKATLPSKEERAADSVMETNTSSIASKRSVQVLYHPKEQNFFRPFVKKPQRRAPLINREYYLRMRAIAESVRRFLREPSDIPKFILNLGCGFDPLPFSLLNNERPSNTTFVDVDYEKLMVNKRIIIEKTESITQLLSGNVEFGTDESAIQIRSKEYIAIGCDLGNLEKLDHVLRTQVLPAECAVLFVAEVSLSYMDVKKASAVIKWASKLSNNASEFIVLEQFLPDGPDHPLASTVLKHYSKLGAPLHSVHEYPSLIDQERRFTDAGWKHAHARSLWDLWSDDTFLSQDLRTSLDAIEPFDEWEELALFSGHYFLLHASMKQGSTGYTAARAGHLTDKSGQFKIIPNCNPPTGQRRFGAILPGDNNIFGYHSGLGRQTRLVDTDIYTKSESPIGAQLTVPPPDVLARMCHSITCFSDNGDCLLVGGRTSPAAALQDCWVRKDNVWRASSPLPTPLFRHSATKVTLGSNGVMIYGGRSSDGTILDTWLLWFDNGEGWQTLETEQQITHPEARFGASLGNINGTCGILTGGIGVDGTILEDFWTWRLQQRPDGSFYLHLRNQTDALNASTSLELLTRFGATIDSTSWGLVVAGGIIPRRVLLTNYQILLLDKEILLRSIESDSLIDAPVLSTIGLGSTFSGSRPLLVGHTSTATSRNEVLLLGGGAVCFPFGAIWTEGTWLLTSADSSAENDWKLVRESVQSPKAADTKPEKRTRKDYTSAAGVTSIPRVRVQSPAQFQQVLVESQPVIIEGSDIGRCTELWTKDYLINAVGADRKVVVHEAQTENMSFQTKNFAYKTKDFGTFMNEVHAGGRQYLRSLSSDQPTKLPATLAVDFPSLDGDFRLPEALSHVVENAHSSPLRISGPVTLWLHYDVMANVLCQIRGEKRLILFPPSDVQHLDVPAGASSSNINIFQGRPDGSIACIPHTSPHEALLKSGDILFIPPLWLHTAAPTGDVSVAVNVFFRNLSQGYAAGRDVYGNRDLQAYEQARHNLERMGKSFSGLPPDVARFYLLRLAKELQDIAKGV